MLGPTCRYRCARTRTSLWRHPATPQYLRANFGTLSFDHYRPKTPQEGQTISPLVILHGLFGSKQNWRSLSKALATRLGTDVYSLDLRNHGDSFHSESHDFPSMTSDVDHFLNDQGLDRVNLVGHSMGGKVSMHYALTHPEKLDHLVVVDMSPAPKDLGSQFGSYITAMQKVADAHVRNKAEAEAILAETISSAPVRQFILTNLKPSNISGSGMRWRVNLSTLQQTLPNLWGFPYADTGKQWTGPALFIGGSKDRYITPEVHPSIYKYFPEAKIEMLEAGHWVHAEKPEEFAALLMNFVKS
ncbi:Alpha/Beta hydrolase protein [Phlyctochytrium arcticum]|nr:Alpha/Beta hydrolase protein [Phlyctochytrium arcticum]